MNRLDRHIAAHILGLSGIVALALVAIYTFINFVADVEDIGQGNFGLLQLMAYTLMLMPEALYTLMPIIAMLGTLMGLGVLATQGELTAMRAAGISLMRIGGSTLMAGAVVGLLCLLLGDFLAPIGKREAEAYRSEARFGVSSDIGGKPVWLLDGDNVFHIQRLIAEDHVAEVDIYALTPDGRLASALHAQQGLYADGGWRFTGVRRTDLQERSAQASEAAVLDWTGTLSPEVLRLFVLKADALTAPGLWRLIRYLDENSLDAGEYRLSLWRKLVAPFTAMAMMLFAVPFVFGALRDTGAGQRLLVGILVGVGFYVVNEVSASLGQLYAWPPLLAAGLPTAGLAAAAFWRLARLR